MAGRPTDYTPELAALICERMGQGQSLRTICLADDMPCPRSIYNWLTTVPGFLQQYEAAVVERADALVEETLEIADDGRNDWMERQSEAEKGKGVNNGWVLNGEHVQRSRLRVDARKWFASKVAPKKYGDKLDVEHAGTVNVTIQR